MSRDLDIDLRGLMGLAVDVAHAAPARSVMDRVGLAPVPRSIEGVSGLERLVLREAARRLSHDLRRATAGLLPGDALVAMACAYRRFALRHPGLYRALVPAPDAGSDSDLAAAVAEPEQIVVDAVTRFGADPRRVPHLVRAFRSLLHGFVMLEREGGFGEATDVDRSFDVLLEAMVATLADHS